MTKQKSKEEEINKTPNKIYLQIDSGTWCEDRIGKTDIPYKRFKKEKDKVKQYRDDCIEEIDESSKIAVINEWHRGFKDGLKRAIEILNKKSKDYER